MNEDYSQPFYVPIGKGKMNLHTGIRGGYYLPALEQPKEEALPVYQDMQWTSRQWDIVNQIKAEVTGWRTKHSEALLEIDRLKAKVDRGSKKYVFTE